MFQKLLVRIKINGAVVNQTHCNSSGRRWLSLAMLQLQQHQLEIRLGPTTKTVGIDLLSPWSKLHVNNSVMHNINHLMLEYNINWPDQPSWLFPLLNGIWLIKITILLEHLYQFFLNQILQYADILTWLVTRWSGLDF